MPLLPITGPTPLDGGTLPVRDDVDALAVLPPEVRRSTEAPIRDALIAAFAEIQREYQRRARRAAACSDLLRAQGYYEDGLASDHEAFRQGGEDDEILRARIFGVQQLVTPNVILAAVNAILATITAKTARYFESELDQLFVEDGTATWACFVYDGTVGATPHYPDRLYSDDAIENGGDVIASREVLGAWASWDNQGRFFILRLPQIDVVDIAGSYILDTDDGAFFADGSDTAGAESDGSVTTFIYFSQTTVDDAYAAIVSTVELLKGQSMRWQAYVDPLL